MAAPAAVSAAELSVGHYHCYLLRSKHPRHPNSTYIGFTVDPRRRIRQHNGEVGVPPSFYPSAQCGHHCAVQLTNGARRTKSKRPWEMTVVISGFPTKAAALQFEWACTYCHRQRRMGVQSPDGSASVNLRVCRATSQAIRKAEAPTPQAEVSIRVQRVPQHCGPHGGCCVMWLTAAVRA